jgi:S1-C subfamily serine protease
MRRPLMNLIGVVGAVAAVAVAVLQPTQLSAQQVGTVSRVVVRNPQGTIEDTLPMIPRVEIILSEARKVQRITDAIDQLVRTVSDSGSQARLLAKKQVPNVISLQLHAADAVLNIHNLCGSSTVRDAYVGVHLLGGKIPGVSVEVLRAAGFAPYPAIVGVDGASPAARAGLTVGDTIIKVNGQDLHFQEFEQFITKPGDKLQLRVVKAGRERDVQVELGANKTRATCDMVFGGNVHRFFRADSAASLAFNVAPVHISRDSGGIRIAVFHSDSAGFTRTIRITTSHPTMAPFAPSLGQRTLQPYLGATLAKASSGYLERAGAASGLMVFNVGPNTFAARGGLRVGDIVVRVGKMPVPDIEEFNKATIAAEKAGRTVVFEIVREGKLQTLSLTTK